MLVTHPLKRYTFHDYKNLDVDDTFLYELINGELVKKSAPSPLHQIISGNLYTAIKNYVFGKKFGTVLYAPVDVFIDEYNAPHPDLLVIKQEHAEYITADSMFGPPDLVVEIVSSGSITRDRIEKLRLYKRFGVPEYWIVDPKYISIEIYQLLNEDYEVFSYAVEKGNVQSRVMEVLY